MMTHPLPVAGKVPVKTLVARQLSTTSIIYTQTHTHTYMYTLTHTYTNLGGISIPYAEPGVSSLLPHLLQLVGKAHTNLKVGLLLYMYM